MQGTTEAYWRKEEARSCAYLTYPSIISSTFSAVCFSPYICNTPYLITTQANGMQLVLKTNTCCMSRFYTHPLGSSSKTGAFVLIGANVLPAGCVRAGRYPLTLTSPWRGE